MIVYKICKKQLTKTENNGSQNKHECSVVINYQKDKYVKVTNQINL